MKATNDHHTKTLTHRCVVVCFGLHLFWIALASTTRRRVAASALTRAAQGPNGAEPIYQRRPIGKKMDCWTKMQNVDNTTKAETEAEAEVMNHFGKLCTAVMQCYLIVLL